LSNSRRIAGSIIAIGAVLALAALISGDTLGSTRAVIFWIGVVYVASGAALLVWFTVVPARDNVSQPWRVTLLPPDKAKDGDSRPASRVVLRDTPEDDDSPA
jgi:hypothetical protein